MKTAAFFLPYSPGFDAVFPHSTWNMEDVKHDT